MNKNTKKLFRIRIRIENSTLIHLFEYFTRL